MYKKFGNSWKTHYRIDSLDGAFSWTFCISVDDYTGPCSDARNKGWSNFPNHHSSIQEAHDYLTERVDIAFRESIESYIDLLKQLQTDYNKFRKDGLSAFEVEDP